MSNPTFVFSATGKIQTFVAPATGSYVIEAAGAQGGASAGPGGSSYNAGPNQSNTPGIQAGDGCVTFTPVLISQRETDNLPVYATAPADNSALESAGERSINGGFSHYFAGFHRTAHHDHERETPRHPSLRRVRLRPWALVTRLSTLPA